MTPPRRRRTRWRVDSYFPLSQQIFLNPVLFPSSKAAPSPTKMLEFPVEGVLLGSIATDLLDVVVRESAAILQLLAGEDKTLLVRGDSLLVLDLALHIVDRVRGLDLQSDGLAREGLHEAFVGGKSVYFSPSRNVGMGIWITYICTTSKDMLASVFNKPMRGDSQSDWSTYS